MFVLCNQIIVMNLSKCNTISQTNQKLKKIKRFLTYIFDTNLDPRPNIF